MTSIQQAMNQTLGSLAGATLAGAHIYRQSGHYQDVLAERKAQKLEETAGDIRKEIHNQIETMDDFETEDGRIKARARTQAITQLSDYEDELLKEAHKTSPKADRTSNLLKIETKKARKQLRKEKAERAALKSLEDSIESKRKQDEAREIRKSILAGTPSEYLLYNQKEDN